MSNSTFQKSVIFFFNFVIALLCLASVVSNFVFPLWRVSLSYTVKGDQLQSLAGQIEGLDAETLADMEIPLSLSVTLETADVILFLFEEDTSATKQLLDKNVDSLVDQILPTVDAFGESVVQEVAKETIREEVYTQIKNQLIQNNPDISEERIQEILQETGLTEDYLSEQTEEVISAFYEEEATVDSICEKTLDVLDSVVTKANESGSDELGEMEITEEDKQQLEEKLREFLEKFAAEDGSLDPKETLRSLLLEYLRASGQTDSDQDSPEDLPQPSPGTEQTAAIPRETDSFVRPLADLSEEEVSSEQELKTELKQLINDQLPENAAGILALVCKVLAAIVLLSMLAWVYLLLKLFFRLFSDRHAIKLKAGILLGGIPGLLLMVLPMLALYLLPRIPYTAALFAEFGLAELGLSFFSAGVFAFGAAILLILISIPYSALRRKERRSN